MTPERFTGAADHHRRQQTMGLAAQGHQLIAGMVRVFGLGEDLSVKLQHLIRSDHQCVGPLSRDFQRFGFGQHIGNITGLCRLGLQRAANGLLVNPRRLTVECESSRRQHRDSGL